VAGPYHDDSRAINRKARVTPRLRRALPALVVAAALAIQFRAVWLGRVYWFEDISAYFQPLWTAAARAMRSGYLPSWDLGAWSGQPLLGDPQVGALYPPNWIWMILNPVRAYAILAAAHAALAAAGMWLLCRARGRSRSAAALGALSLALGAFMVLQVRHAMFGATTAWLVWLAWAVERWAETRRIDRLVAAAAALALALYAGGWSMLYFGAWVIAALALVRVAAVERAARRRVVVGLAAAAALGLALAAAQLLPALAHARLSPRALGLSAEEAASYAWPSWRYLVTLLLPNWFGSTAAGTYVGAPDQWELCGYGIGAVATLLAPFALLDRERRREHVVLGLLCAAAVLLARGAGGPLYPLARRTLPMFSSLRCPARALYVWTLVAPLLAADGLDALRARLAPARRSVVGALACGLVAAELLWTWRAENPSTTLAATQARPAAVDELLEHRRPSRLINDVHLGQRFHNAGLLWGIESAVGYSSIPIWRYLNLLWAANHGAPYPHAQIAQDLSAQGLWRLRSPIVDLLSVEWVLAPREWPVDAPGFERVFEGDDGVDLWRNHEAWPRAMVVYRTRRVADEDAAARAVADPAWRPERAVVIERALPSVPELRADETPPPGTPIGALAREDPLDLWLEAEAQAPGVLVVSSPWYPGWRARVDGAPAELLRVDYALVGVVLPPGRHAVALERVDAPLRAGGAITIAALAAACGLLLRERRRRAVY
jgi:hypothetical protein